jgi:hypothetical protein
MSFSDFKIHKESCKTWSDSEVLGEIFFYNLQEEVNLQELDKETSYQVHAIPGLSLKLLLILEENHVDVMDLINGLESEEIENGRFFDITRKIASEYSKKNTG